MVVRYEHMWLTIPALLIPIAFVILMMAFTKIWMFGAPKRERIIPSYSLQVMKDLPPDKPVPRPKTNPYASSKRRNPYYNSYGAKPKEGMFTKNKNGPPPQYQTFAPQVHRPQPQYPARTQTGYPMPQHYQGY